MCFFNINHQIHFVDDHSRVILERKRADYINANYIDVSLCPFDISINILKKTKQKQINCLYIIFFQGSKRKKMFIAAQGKSCICNLCQRFTLNKSFCYILP